MVYSDFMRVFVSFFVHSTAGASQETSAIRRLYLGAWKEKVKDESSLERNEGSEGDRTLWKGSWHGRGSDGKWIFWWVFWILVLGSKANSQEIIFEMALVQRGGFIKVWGWNSWAGKAAVPWLWGASDSIPWGWGGVNGGGKGKRFQIKTHRNLEGCLWSSWGGFFPLERH